MMRYKKSKTGRTLALIHVTNGKRRYVDWKKYLRYTSRMGAAIYAGGFLVLPKKPPVITRRNRQTNAMQMVLYGLLVNRADGEYSEVNATFYVRPNVSIQSVLDEMNKHGRFVRYAGSNGDKLAGRKVRVDSDMLQRKDAAISGLLSSLAWKREHKHRGGGGHHTVRANYSERNDYKREYEVK